MMERRATLPTAPRLATAPTPATTMQSTSGPNVMVSRLTNASPSGLRALPVVGHSRPTAAPSAMAINTQIYRWRYHGVRGGTAVRDADVAGCCVMISPSCGDPVPPTHNMMERGTDLIANVLRQG